MPRHLTRQELYDFYIVKGLTIRQIYEMCGYRTPCMIQRWLRKYGIERDQGRDGWSDRSRKGLSENWRTEERLKGAKKQSETKKMLFAKGLLKSWNRGSGGFMRGENNPMYGKKRSLEVRKRLREIKYKNGIGIYRELAFGIYGKKCSVCGFSEEECLEVHHIDKNRYNNSIENLVILCLNCHRLVHRGKIEVD